RDVDRPAFAVGRPRRREIPEMEAELVGHGRVVAVAGEVLRADLPVRLGHPVIRRAVDLATAQALLEVDVQVELESAEVVLQVRRLRVVGAEAHARGLLGAYHDLILLAYITLAPYARQHHGTAE